MRYIPISEICETINGLWTGKKEPFIDVKVYTMSNFTRESDLNHDTAPRVIKASLSQYEKRKLKYGDILIEKSGGGPNQPVGRAVFFDIQNDRNNTFSNFTTRLRLNEDYLELIDKKYLHYFLKRAYMLGETEKFQKNSTNIRNLQLKQYLAMELPVFTLQEQKQIVNILDEAFAAIDQAKANLEKNIENAKELFQSKLNEIFSHPSTGSGRRKGDGWESDKLINLTTKIGSGSTPRGGQKSYKTEGISLIRSMNVHDDRFEPNKLAFIDEEQADKLKNVVIEEEDVLLNITGASVARCCVVDKDYLPARVNQHVSIIRPIKEKLESSFLHLSLISKPNKDKLLGIGEQGATRQAITKAQIEQFLIDYPESLSEQQKISEALEIFKTSSQTLVDKYEEKLELMDELKKSILQKAFSGELTSEPMIQND